MAIKRTILTLSEVKKIIANRYRVELEEVEIYPNLNAELCFVYPDSTNKVTSHDLLFQFDKEEEV